MFKKGQILRHRLTGSAVLIIEWPRVRRLTKPTIGRAPVGQEYCVSKHLEHYFDLIGNNYQEKPGAADKRVLTETVPHDQAIGKETHNLIQNLRRDNKELRRQNKDLRDDIGDMASKLHLANKRTLEIMTPHAKEFPGTAFKRWLSDVTGDLPEQRGCRKEDC